MKTLIRFSLLLISCTLSCINEYNPFNDLNNVMVVVNHSSFENRDSVPIFSPETLSVTLTLKFHIDSITIKAKNNRYWTDTVLRQSATLADDYKFIFSCVDTGQNEIVVAMFRDDGNEHTTVFSFRTYSPLKQEPIRSSFDDSLHLTTPPVLDNVIYHWDFGAGVIIKSNTPDRTCLISNAAKDSTGWLWVTDRTGNQQSPKTPFSFAFFDTTGPRIECLNRGLIPGTDTVRTGDSTWFDCILLITDRISNQVKEALIDNEQFDKIDLVSNKYTKQIDSIFTYTQQNPKKVTISALDNVVPPNRSTRTLYFYYDSTMAPSPKTAVTITSVDLDTIFTSVTPYPISGTIVNRERQPIYLSLTLNDTTSGAQQYFKFGNDNWYWEITLRENIINNVTVTATDSNGIIQAEESVAIYFDATLADTTGPEIVEVAIEEMDLRNNTTTLLNPKVGITCFDRNSKVNSVKMEVNGTTSIHPITNDSSTFLWQTVADLNHGDNLLLITCYDDRKNFSTERVNVTQNILPLLSSPLSLPYYICNDSIYTDTLKVYDFDNDDVTTTLFSPAPAGMQLDAESHILTWEPKDAVLGINTMLIRLYDGVQDTMLTFSYMVIDSIPHADPVAFSIDESDFPEMLIANKTTLSLPLSIKANTGLRPLSFNAFLQESDTVILHDSKDSLLVWTPSLQDTGVQQLIVTVTDRQGTSDTLFPSILILPENSHACSLSVACLTPSATLVDTVVTLSNLTDTVVLRYTIIDADDPRTEHYRLTKTIDNITQTFETDAKTFTVSLLPKKSTTPELLRIVVNDITGQPDTLTLKIIYPVSRSMGQNAINKKTPDANAPLPEMDSEEIPETATQTGRTDG